MLATESMPAETRGLDQPGQDEKVVVYIGILGREQICPKVF